MEKVIAMPELISIPVTVEFLEEDEVYQVSCPWLQGCHAWGETLDEALRAIPGNIRAMLEARRSKGDKLPAPLQGLDPTRPFTLKVILS